MYVGMAVHFYVVVDECLFETCSCKFSQMILLKEGPDQRYQLLLRQQLQPVGARKLWGVEAGGGLLLSP